MYRLSGSSIKEVRHKSTDKASLVGVTQPVRRKRYQKNRDMRDRAMVSHAGQTANAWLLDGDGQQPAEDAFDGGAAVVVFPELISSIGNSVSDIIGETPEIVASLLPGEFRMPDGAEQQIGLGAVKEGAAILDIGDPFDRHVAMAVHREFGGAEDLLALSLEPCLILGVARVVWNEGTSPEDVNDVFENGLHIVFRITADGVEAEPESLDWAIEQGDGQGSFGDGVGHGDLPQGQFGFEVGQCMVAITQKYSTCVCPGLG